MPRSGPGLDSCRLWSCHLTIGMLLQVEVSRDLKNTMLLQKSTPASS